MNAFLDWLSGVAPILHLQALPSPQHGFHLPCLLCTLSKPKVRAASMWHWTCWPSQEFPWICHSVDSVVLKPDVMLPYTLWYSSILHYTFNVDLPPICCSIAFTSESLDQSIILVHTKVLSRAANNGIDLPYQVYDVHAVVLLPATQFISF